MRQEKEAIEKSVIYIVSGYSKGRWWRRNCFNHLRQARKFARIRDEPTRITKMTVIQIFERVMDGKE